MGSLYSLVDGKGRISHDSLKNYVYNNSISVFTEQARHPFLVGKKLYEGEIKKQSPRPDGGINTMKFDAADVKAAVEKRMSMTSTVSVKSADIFTQNHSGISHAIFMLKKKAYSLEPDPDKITIGRSQENDIVISDYAISKQHARILIFKDKYFIVDAGSTNGTAVNEIAVKPGMKVQLTVNSPVAFGRLCFVFAHALQVYRGMRKEIMGI